MKPSLRMFSAVSALSLALVAAEPAAAQKSGGVLKIYHWDSPASMSIHEEATYSTVVPMMGVFNNLVMYDQHVPQNSLQSIVPDLATSWSWNEEGTELSFKLRRGIRRQAVYRRRRHMHLGPAARQFEREASGQPAQGLVQEPREGYYRRRLRCHVPSEAAAAVLSSLARFRLLAGLSLPCFATRNAYKADRHRPVQVCRVQAQRSHQGCQEPGLLEEGPASAGRHRVYDHKGSVDAASGVYRRQVRHDLPLSSST